MSSNIFLKIFLVFLTSSTSISHKLPEFSVQPWPKPSSNQINSRIAFGHLARDGQFPYQVALVTRRTTGFSLCGGSIISSLFVVTAAHCAYNAISTTISFGSIDRAKPLFTLVATQVFIHENYDQSTLNNDIALWKLPREITFNERVQKIALPSLSQVSDSFESKTAIASGWGHVENPSAQLGPLRFAPMRVIGNPECVETFGHIVITPATICTLGGEIIQQSVCPGDSGGPLALRNNETDVLIGIASFVSGTVGCAGGRPAGYVRVSAFLEWIGKITGIICK